SNAQRNAVSNAEKRREEKSKEVPKGTSIGASRDRPLPDDWSPTPEHRQRALDEGLDLDREAIKFREHAKEKGRKAKNWNSAFARWLINAGEYKQTRTPNGGGFS